MSKIVVIVPVYNAAENLRSCINSILNQSVSLDVSVVLVDHDETELVPGENKFNMEIKNNGNVRVSQVKVSVYDELEAIVGAGTKINIDYYIRMIVDEDKVDDIYEYFKEEATSDSVNEAMKALGPDYTEEEVRLIRIKFLSELGN